MEQIPIDCEKTKGLISCQFQKNLFMKNGIDLLMRLKLYYLRFCFLKLIYARSKIECDDTCLKSIETSEPNQITTK